MAGGVSSTIQDSRRRVLVRRRKRILLRNEAQLNFVSLRSPFDYVARRGLSRVEMNAQKRAPLTALSAPREECFHFWFDNADVVIEGMLRQRGQGCSTVIVSSPHERYYLNSGDVCPSNKLKAILGTTIRNAMKCFPNRAPNHGWPMSKLSRGAAVSIFPPSFESSRFIRLVDCTWQ